MNPLAAIYLPTVYSLVSILALAQISVVVKLLSSFLNLKTSNAIVLAAKPAARTLAAHLEGSFGSAYIPSATQVLLTAIMIAFIVHLERLRSTIINSSRRQ